MNIHNIPEIKISAHRLICTGCGSEANATCNCGLPYNPKAIERAREERAKDPDASDRQIMERARVSKGTANRARAAGPNGPLEENTDRNHTVHRDPANLLISAISQEINDFHEHVEDWLLEHPSAPPEALGALAMAISNASDLLAELAAKLNRGISND